MNSFLLYPKASAQVLVFFVPTQSVVFKTSYSVDDVLRFVEGVPNVVGVQEGAGKSKQLVLCNVKP